METLMQKRLTVINDNGFTIDNLVLVKFTGYYREPKGYKFRTSIANKEPSESNFYTVQVGEEMEFKIDENLTVIVQVENSHNCSKVDLLIYYPKGVIIFPKKLR